MPNLSLPIGIDDFQKLRENDYYYVDKTGIIKELLDKRAEVNLFTRPRRFGKSLNLSMLRYFFELPVDGKNNTHLFEGLEIMSAGEKYTKEQGQYPVIALSLKAAKQPDFNMAYASLVDDIGREYDRHNEVLRSENISAADKEKFIRIRDRKADRIDYAKSLLFLSQCLEKYYGRKVLLLLDEYDVPLETAHYQGFYEEMTGFIRSLFESVLKSNPYLEFAVITGCLRISKESIFTGLNNLEIISILNVDYGEYFGFTESEVKKMLSVYGLEEKMDIMKTWYDGYRFGNTEVYNPWSVIHFTKSLCADRDAFPTPAWSNTSSNSIVKDLIERADETVKGEIEALVSGSTIEKKVQEDITYEDIYQSEDNLWNFLFFTGYLKLVSMRMEGVNRYMTLAIPNAELLYIYENTIENWFRDELKSQDLSGLYRNILDGDEEAMQFCLEEQLQNTISYMDHKEAFYHGFLIGILSQLKGYRIKSNREAGNGRYDICIYSLNVRKPAILLELKIAKEFRLLEKACEEALAQIEEKQYDAELKKDGYEEILCYGLGFYKKQVQVKKKI